MHRRANAWLRAARRSSQDGGVSSISERNRVIVVTCAVMASLVVAGCAAGDPRFTEEAPAGFWVGLWHGMISVITLIVGIFYDSVEIYERNNTGGWYDLGYLIGVTLVWGGGSHTAHRRSRSRRDQKEWEEIGRKVEAKIKRKIRVWAEAEPDEDWNLVETKAEEKLKRKIREWAEEPEAPAPAPAP
jgi:hypothetical protein